MNKVSNIESNLSKNIKIFLCIFTAILVAISCFIYLNRNQSQIAFRTTTPNPNTRKLLQETCMKLLPMDTKYFSTGIIVSKELNSKVIPELSDCQIYLAKSYRIPKSIYKQILSRLFNIHDPPDGPVQLHIVLNEHKKKGWIVNVEDSSFGDFLSDNKVTIREIDDLNKLSQFFIDLQWLSKKDLQEWQNINSNTWELPIPADPRHSSAIVVHTNNDDIVINTQLVSRPNKS